MRAAVQDRLAALPYLHVEQHEVDRLLARAGIADPGRAPADALARALDVDALVRGRVTSLYNLEGGVVYRQALGGDLSMVDRAGRVLAVVTHTEAMTGGLLLNYGQSFEAVQQTLDNSSDIGFVRLAERFADAVVRALPAPPAPVEVTRPTIESVVVTAREGTLGVAEEVAVEARATPALEGSFDLGHGVAEVPLVEEAPGVYRGWYRVALGDRSDEPPSVHVSDRFGVGASRVLRERPLPIEARPPAAPTRLALDGQGRLTWVGCGEAARYRVYALDARGVPTLLAEVTSTEAVVPDGARRLAVAGLDAQGDLGPLGLLERGLP